MYVRDWSLENRVPNNGRFSRPCPAGPYIKGVQKNLMAQIVCISCAHILWTFYSLKASLSHCVTYLLLGTARHLTTIFIFLRGKLDALFFMYAKRYVHEFKYTTPCKKISSRSSNVTIFFTPTCCFQDTMYVRYMMEI